MLNAFTIFTIIFAVVQLCITLIPKIFKDKNQRGEVTYTKQEIALMVLPIVGFILSIGIFVIGQDKDANSRNAKAYMDSVYRADLEKQLAKRD